MLVNDYDRKAKRLWIFGYVGTRRIVYYCVLRVYSEHYSAHILVPYEAVDVTSCVYVCARARAFVRECCGLRNSVTRMCLSED